MSEVPDFGPMENYIGFQIHVTWRAIRKLLLESGPAGHERISRGTWSVPILIGLNPGITPQELARALHLDASKVAVLLGPLEADGMIERTRSESDRRRVALRLSEAGEALARRALSNSETIERPITAAITEAERSELMRILAKIRAAGRKTG
jgi:DNA-binding MarR family transcriptional regulator